ncbi:hypothetical protein GXM_03013 [Nostoc sphaeroides CCNUC1]|uniref:Uncharacterized protein n=1 Tax=Nostoc sphaeroides CCNUC1 TaxID=2653204 RepID=A0A5P8VZR5_9NOSO|nr:hypothetical protein GXM_03013 [Nostoc sphaeroides CCNUC1]
MGWATREPLTKGGQDVYPTSSSNLFLGNPLDAHIKIFG